MVDVSEALNALTLTNNIQSTLAQAEKVFLALRDAEQKVANAQKALADTTEQHEAVKKSLSAATEQSLATKTAAGNTVRDAHKAAQDMRDAAAKEALELRAEIDKEIVYKRAAAAKTLSLVADKVKEAEAQLAFTNQALATAQAQLDKVNKAKADLKTLLQ